MPDRRELAKRFIARGWSYRRTANVLGVSAATIQRWVKPEFAEQQLVASRAWKADHRKDTRAYDHEYLDRVKIPCPWCENRMEPTSEMCQDCHESIAETKRSVIIGCYEGDWPLREIAAVLETTANTVHVEIHRLRRAGRVGYRYRMGPGGRRLPDRLAA